MSKTKEWLKDSELVESVTVETVHGAVEYDAVECSGCGEMVKAEDAIPVGLGHKKDRCDGWDCVEYHDTADSRRALCEYCAEGIFDYNTSAWRTTANWYNRRALALKILIPALIGGMLTTAVVLL